MVTYPASPVYGTPTYITGPNGNILNNPTPNSNPQPTPGTLTNVNQAQLAAQIASWAAQLEFSKTRFQLLELPQFQSQDAQARQSLQVQIDQLAFQKAQAAYQNALQEAALTGMYQGKPTLQWLTEQAQLTGVLDGQQTLQGKLTDAQIAQMNHSMQLESQNFQLQYAKYGTDTEHWERSFAQQSQNDLRNYMLAEAGVTGKFNGQDTLAQQSLNETVRAARANEAEQAASRQQQGALGYLNLLTQVQNNPFKMLRVQQNAKDFNTLAAGWLGQIQMPGSGTIAANPGGIQGVSDLFIQNGVDGSANYLPGTGPVGVGTPYNPYPQTGAAGAAGVASAQGTQALDPVTGYAASPPGTQAPVGDYNYETGSNGQTQVYPPGVAAPASGSQVSTTTPQTPTTAYKLNGDVAGASGMTSDTSYAGGSLTPNKINAENYQASDAGQQKLLWQYFDDQGWSPEMAQSIFQKSLPKYGGPAAGRVVRA